MSMLIITESPLGAILITFCFVVCFFVAIGAVKRFFK